MASNSSRFSISMLTPLCGSHQEIRFYSMAPSGYLILQNGSAGGRTQSRRGTPPKSHACGMYVLYYTTVGVIKNAPSRNKCAKLWQFLAVVYNVVFPFFSFFWPREKQICMWKDLFLHTAKSGHHKRPWSHTFFLVWIFFTRCLAKIEIKEVQNFWWPKKSELGPLQRRKPQELLWPTAWATRAAWAVKSLKNRIWLAQVFFLPRRITRIIKSGGNMI